MCITFHWWVETFLSSFSSWKGSLPPGGRARNTHWGPPGSWPPSGHWPGTWADWADPHLGSPGCLRGRPGTSCWRWCPPCPRWACGGGCRSCRRTSLQWWRWAAAGWWSRGAPSSPGGFPPPLWRNSPRPSRTCSSSRRYTWGSRQCSKCRHSRSSPPGTPPRRQSWASLWTQPRTRRRYLFHPHRT